MQNKVVEEFTFLEIDLFRKKVVPALAGEIIFLKYALSLQIT